MRDMLVPLDDRSNAAKVYNQWQKVKPSIEKFANGESDTVTYTPTSPLRQPTISSEIAPQLAQVSQQLNDIDTSLDKETSLPSTRSQMSQQPGDLDTSFEKPPPMTQSPRPQTPTQSTYKKQKRPPPQWLRTDADQWLFDKLSRHARELDEAVGAELLRRDHVFLIDDSFLMRKYWKEVADIVHLLSEILFTLKADDKIEVVLVSI